MFSRARRWLTTPRTYGLEGKLGILDQNKVEAIIAKAAGLTGLSTTYAEPPGFRPLPLAQWFETAHTGEIMNHQAEMKGDPPVLKYFYPWNLPVRLDSFHFMRRFTKGLTTEHHPLYGTFCTRLSGCIFMWDEQE
ncbi:hypothetical protein Bbelb_185770 [Branchiostoma belcheri]|nr:hypothetical protein Bbelb_185770 [Branchiostoma belcheri]